jgi:hypothetical protein
VAFNDIDSKTKNFFEKLIKSNKPVKINKLEFNSNYSDYEKQLLFSKGRELAGQAVGAVSERVGKASQTVGESFRTSSVAGQVAGLTLDVAKQLGIVSEDKYGGKSSHSKWGNSLLKMKDDKDDFRYKSYNSKLDKISEGLGVKGDIKTKKDTLDKMIFKKRSFTEMVQKEFIKNKALKNEKRKKQEMHDKAKEKLRQRLQKIAEMREQNVKTIKSNLEKYKAKKDHMKNFSKYYVDLVAAKKQNTKLISMSKQKMVLENLRKKSAEKRIRSLDSKFLEMRRNLSKKKKDDDEKKKEKTKKEKESGGMGGKLMAGLLAGGLMFSGLMGGKSGSGVFGMAKSTIFGNSPEAWNYEIDPETGKKIRRTDRVKGSGIKFATHGLGQALKFGAIGSMIGGEQGALIGGLIGAMQGVIEWMWKEFVEPFWVEKLQPAIEGIVNSFGKIKKSKVGQILGLDSDESGELMTSAGDRIFGKDMSKVNLKDRSSSVRIFEQYAVALDDLQQKNKISKEQETMELSEGIAYLKSQKTEENKETIDVLNKMLKSLIDLNKKNVSISKPKSEDLDAVNRLKNQYLQ